MRLLVDTSILVNASQPDSPHFASALRAVSTLADHGYIGVVVPQIIYEYWVVATRPAENNGLGLAVPNATLEIARIAGILPVLRDERGIFERWQQLVTAHDVKGKLSHDARLVAAMQRHGVDHVLTGNANDFKRFDGIHVHTPGQITGTG